PGPMPPGGPSGLISVCLRTANLPSGPRFCRTVLPTTGVSPLTLRTGGPTEPTVGWPALRTFPEGILLPASSCSIGQGLQRQDACGAAAGHQPGAGLAAGR